MKLLVAWCPEVSGRVAWLIVSSELGVKAPRYISQYDKQIKSTVNAD
ncbi:MAG: hypothetical protein ACOXZ9_01255 [Bacteroidales bacterium]|jgi:hypothetical protein